MKKVLFITYEYPTYTPFGGIAFYYYRVTNILADHNFEITVVSAKIESNRKGLLEENSIGKITHVFISCNNPVEFESYVIQWLFEQKTKYDVIEIPEQSALFLQFILNGFHRHLRAKFVVRVHGTTVLSRLYNSKSNFTSFNICFYNTLLLNSKIIKIVKLLNSKIYGIAKRNFKEFNLVKIADVITAPSYLMGDFVNSYWLKKKETRVFPNPSQYSVGNYEKSNFNNKILKVSYINRLQYWKGFDLFHILSKKYSVGGNIQFTAYGSYSQLNIGFTEDQISETIELKGFTDSIKLIDVYRQSQIVIVPSRFESFSNVALEAMGFGCIGIVSDKIGMSEHITHGMNGFKFKSGKYHSLESVFSEIIRMENIEKERVSFNAYQTALKLSENSELIEFYRSV